eukprot:TRINITY_DN70110_c0_g1_i1.p1 TRINITY_DN70110_c0_g1~~TRINITY_DN70110_c0_g1_i1.p1  ORF type:complete len:574 (+),score=89.78 TRINITY_DN70110_c0_g1_i1:73-1794(+)
MAARPTATCALCRRVGAREGEELQLKHGSSLRLPPSKGSGGEEASDGYVELSWGQGQSHPVATLKRQMADGLVEILRGDQQQCMAEAKPMPIRDKDRIILPTDAYVISYSALPRSTHRSTRDISSAEVPMVMRGKLRKDHMLLSEPRQDAKPMVARDTGCTHMLANGQEVMVRAREPGFMKVQHSEGGVLGWVPETLVKLSAGQPAAERATGPAKPPAAAPGGAGKSNLFGPSFQVTQQKLEKLKGIFEHHHEDDLRAALRRHGGNVQMAIEVLLRGDECGSPKRPAEQDEAGAKRPRPDAAAADEHTASGRRPAAASGGRRPAAAAAGGHPAAAAAAASAPAAAGRGRSPKKFSGGQGIGTGVPLEEVVHQRFKLNRLPLPDDSGLTQYEHGMLLLTLYSWFVAMRVRLPQGSQRLATDMLTCATKLLQPVGTSGPGDEAATRIAYRRREDGRLEEEWTFLRLRQEKRADTGALLLKVDKVTHDGNVEIPEIIDQADERNMGGPIVLGIAEGLPHKLDPVHVVVILAACAFARDKTGEVRSPNDSVLSDWWVNGGHDFAVSRGMSGRPQKRS